MKRPTFEAILAARLSRRTVVSGAAATWALPLVRTFLRSAPATPVALVHEHRAAEQRCIHDRRWLSLQPRGALG